MSAFGQGLTDAGGVRVPEFASFDAFGGAELWRAIIRPMVESDVSQVARHHAAREGLSIAESDCQVLDWLADDHRLILVADHAKQVHGYAGATFLEAKAMDGLHVSGWYLSGVVVYPASRRHGLGAQLTAARLATIREKSNTAWYFVNAENRASIALHAKFGFVEHSRDRRICGVEFNGGVGVLFRLGGLRNDGSSVEAAGGDDSEAQLDGTLRPDDQHGQEVRRVEE